MPNPRLAFRYAKSLIDLAIEKNLQEAIYKDMQFLQSVCRSSREFVVLLKSPVIPGDKKDKVIEAIGGDHMSAVTLAFCRLLVHKKRESFLPEIVTAFIQQYKDYKGIHSIRLLTAAPISKGLKQEIVEKVRSEKGMENIELDTAVKEELIGGFILEIGDQMVDASIAFGLNNVRKQFRNNEFVYKIR
jgi:F-type H+-transporting ATPase subunit delta